MNDAVRNAHIYRNVKVRRVKGDQKYLDRCLC
uniref:Uncharacterized protein n=1 Tax=Arundo donax TaxID=35708 RepID=A0A0A9EEG9_ARUDO